MSQTLAATRLAIRLLMGDDDIGKPAIKSERMNRIIVRQAQMASAIVHPGETWVTSIVTITGSGGTDFTLSGTSEYDSILELRRASDGLLLERVPFDQMESARQASTPATGRPYWYYIYENFGPSIRIRLYPTPNSADTLDALVRRTSAAAYTDTTAIDGSELVFRAVELNSAAECYAVMHQSERDRLKLSGDAAALWKTDAERLLRLEKDRRGHLRDISHIPAQVD